MVLNAKAKIFIENLVKINLCKIEFSPDDENSIKKLHSEPRKFDKLRIMARKNL